MTQEKGFNIEVSCSYPEFWRYNVALMCGCFNREDERTGFASSEDTVADVGANLSIPPKNYPAHRISTLETPPCDHIVLYVYIIPHTLPAGRDVSDTQPFPIAIRILAPDGTQIRHVYQINQWSGASIELKVPSAE